MIDILKERLLPLGAAAEILPGRRRGKRPHPGTLKRWSRHGFRGVFLEVIHVGDTLCTSAEALQRFLNSVTNAAQERDHQQQLSPFDKRHGEYEDSLEKRLAEKGL